MHTFDLLDGALLIDKPAGLTSHDVVDCVRGLFHVKKVGHCGTLDPNATGLLVLLLGRATKLAEKLMADDKVYEGTMRFGVETASYDADGEVTATLAVPPLTLDQLNAAAATFHGDVMQLPPMVSAVKIKGVPLYKLARKGMDVERKERLVHIYTYEFTAYAEPIAWFRVACTKGTYVRTLAFDLGRTLGCGAHLRNLRRLVSGQFDIADAIPLEDLSALGVKDLQPRLIPFVRLVQMTG
ncbi:MAG: tRNA pseudouridine(55) synthase TruB [Verrucomicrobia bacterium]|nr:tRNA pseudouridine(55) synthase TruB [Verrucomicrobiota bacterium]